MPSPTNPAAKTESNKATDHARPTDAHRRPVVQCTVIGRFAYHIPRVGYAQSKRARELPPAASDGQGLRAVPVLTNITTCKAGNMMPRLKLMNEAGQAVLDGLWGLGQLPFVPRIVRQPGPQLPSDQTVGAVSTVIVGNRRVIT